MTDRAILLDKFTPGGEALVPGADNTDLVNGALEAIARDYRDGTTAVAVDGKVTCDGTVVLERAQGVRLTPRKAGSGFQTLSHTGGLEPPQARIRAHVSINRCVDSGVCNDLDIGGTHPEDGPNSSPTIPANYWRTVDDDPSNDHWPTRNIHEGQSGVRVVGSKGTVVQANIHHVWGDFVETQHHAPRPGEYYGNEDTLIVGGRWHRNGRVAVKVAANKGLRWYGTELSRCVGEKLHVESGSNPLSDQRDLYVERLVLDGFGRNLVGCSGGSRIDGLYVGNIVKIGGCLQVGCDGPARLLGVGAAKYTRFRFWNWVWDEPETGGVIAAFKNIDGLDYASMSGPVRKVVQERLQFRTTSCRDAHVDLSGIDRV